MPQHIKIHPIPIIKDNYVWTLIDNKNSNAIIIDAGDAAPIIEYLDAEKLNLLAILVTHKHWDHTDGVEELMTRYRVPVFASQLEKISYITHPIAQDHAEILIEKFPLKFTAMFTPGHTCGHITYISDGMAFTGDTLFACGCGRLTEGTAAEMFSSLEKIATLPDDTKLYPGHEYTLSNLRFAHAVDPTNSEIMSRIKHVEALRAQNLPSLPTTVSEEKATNPFLRCANSHIKNSVGQYAKKKLETPLEVFAALRLWKDKF